MKCLAEAEETEAVNQNDRLGCAAICLLRAGAAPAFDYSIGMPHAERSVVCGCARGMRRCVFTMDAVVEDESFVFPRP